MDCAMRSDLTGFLSTAHVATREATSILQIFERKKNTLNVQTYPQPAFILWLSRMAKPRTDKFRPKYLLNLIMNDQF